MTNQDNVLKSRDITLPTKVHLVKAMVFPVVMYACENWTIKKAECRKTETLESPLDCKEIQPVYPKGKQSWVFIGRTDAEDEAPVLWPPDVKSQLIGNDLDAGKDWRQEEKQMTEDKIFGWYHRLSGHEFEQALGDGEEQGSLECCTPWGPKESDMTYQLNNNKIQMFSSVQFTQSCPTLCDPMDCSTPTSLSFTISQSLLKFVSIELMPSNHLILNHPLLLLPSIFPSIRVFSNESALHIRWPKYWNFSISPSNAQ